MAFFWACSMLCHRSSLLFSASVNSGYLVSTLILFSFSVNIITMLSISVYLKNRPKHIARIPSLPFIVSASLGVISYSLVSFVSGSLVMGLILVGGLLTGLGFGYLWGSWAEVYGRMHPSRNAVLMVLVFIMTLVFFFVVSWLKEALGIPVVFLMILLPPASYLCLRHCRAKAPQSDYSHTDKDYLDAIGSLWRLLFGAVVLSFLFGFTWQLTVIFTGSVNDSHRLPLLGNLAIGLVLLGLVLFTNRHVNLDVIYRFIGPAIVGFCLLAPWFLQSTPVMLNTIMSTGFGVFDVVIWYMVSECSYDRRVSGFIIGSVVRSISLVARLIGIVVASLFAALPSESNLLLFALFVGSGYLLVIWLVAYRRHRTSQTFEREAEKLDADKRDVQVGDELDRIMVERVRLMADTFQLTRREAEVLPYLLQGRSAGYIADVQFVSENTIRSHIRRILEKTDTHSKQNLIDIADALILRQRE
jgi:DNA-binding CsgD family transcriptional regulator